MISYTYGRFVIMFRRRHEVVFFFFPFCRIHREKFSYAIIIICLFFFLDSGRSQEKVRRVLFFICPSIHDFSTGNLSLRPSTPGVISSVLFGNKRRENGNIRRRRFILFSVFRYFVNNTLYVFRGLKRTLQLFSRCFKWLFWIIVAGR